MKPIEFVDFKTQASLIGSDIKHSIDRVIAHGRFIMGPEIYELEEKLSDFTDAKYVVSCASGTDALLMALMAIGVGPGDAVFTSPFTFIATAEVISLLGAVPVFVDIQKDTFNLDPVKLEQAIETLNKCHNAKLTAKCIIPVDIFGLPAEYETINKIAVKYNLIVIEDAAQSLGAQAGDKLAGNLTDIATTSFFPAKPLGCYGDGGAIFTNDSRLNEKLISIRVHGKGQHKYDNVRLGINGRMDTLQAAILIQKLKIFKDELKKRLIIAQKYRERLNGWVQFQTISDQHTSAWAQFSFLSKDRSSIMTKLETNNIPHAIYYPKPLHLQEAFSMLKYKKGDFPIAETVSDTILSIPMHPYLSDDHMEFITQTIVSVLN
ncbi:MAG: DegT/DnrJ/EryC1/StrS family aminotransferase [Desulfobacula sp.]|jgi:UDP-2-acetamido-2-deoxy-ribo-hexuluronate aminotransferase|nr:DegT/DnrJ/EryC1/StrS family aminotransferase [Desulfobacula sp.]